MNDASTLERLRRIGLAPTLAQHVLNQPASGAGSALMRVTEVHREGLTLHDGIAECAARQLPGLRSQLAAAEDALAVGDWVLARRNGLAEWWAHARLPPLNQLARRQPEGRDGFARSVIVSNVDTALLVMGLDGDYNPRRLERYLALVRMAGVSAGWC